MPTFEPNFRTYLLSNLDLSGIIGQRLFFQTQPQDERRPRVIIRASHLQTRTIDNGPVNDWTSVLSIDALAPTYREASQTAFALNAILTKIRQNTLGGTQLIYCSVSPAEDIPAMPVEGSAKPLTYGKNIRGVCHWREV